MEEFTRAHGLNILIFDDDEADIKIFKSYLTLSAAEDYNLISAINSNELYSILEKYKNNIDIIFLDYNMPEKSGLLWLNELKELNIAPIVMLTGYGDEGTAVEAMKQGAVDYIPKSKLDSYEIVKTIQNALERWEIEKERDALLGIAAHELRNPLATIYGYSQILENFENVDEQKKKEIYSILKERTEFLLNTVNKLLDITRIKKGTITLQKSEHDFVGFIKSMVKELSYQADRKKIGLNLTSSHLELIVNYDEHRMSEVILNLLDNAIKYSPPGSKIEINLETENNLIHLGIKDEGPGIKEGELKYLFKLFSNVKVSTTPTGGEKSTGLGLAICKKIVSLHDGEISVETEVGKGSKFNLTLPIN